MNKRQTSFGRGLKTARGLSKLSLREVEAATGVSNAYLSQLENDKIKRPAPYILRKLAVLYDVCYEPLVVSAGYAKRKTSDGTETFPGAALFSDKMVTPEEQKALANYLAFLRRK